MIITVHGTYNYHTIETLKRLKRLNSLQWFHVNYGLNFLRIWFEAFCGQSVSEEFAVCRLQLILSGLSDRLFILVVSHKVNSLPSC